MDRSAPPRRKPASLRERLLSTETLAVLLVAALALIATNAVSSLVPFRPWVAAVAVLYLVARWAVPAVRRVAGTSPRARRWVVIGAVALFATGVAVSAGIAWFARGRDLVRRSDVALRVRDAVMAISPDAVTEAIRAEFRFKNAMRYRLGPRWFIEATPRARELAERISDSADLVARAVRHAARGEADEAVRLLDLARKERGLGEADAARLAGDAYYFADRCPEAVASYRKVFDAAPRDPSVQVDYGAVLLACAPEQATEDLFAPLVETLDKTRGKNDLDTALALDNLAEFYTQTNLAADAIQYRTTAIEAFDKAIGGEHPAVASSLVRLAASCNRLGLKEEALEYLTLARQIREQGVGPRHPSVAEAYWLTARTERALARNKAAADHLKLAQDIDPRVDAVGFSGVRLARTTASGPERQEPPVTRKPDPVQDAWKLMSEKRYVEAEMLLRGEIARLRYADASEDSALIPVWDVLQTVYRMQGKREKEYQDVAREVREIYIAGQVRRLEARTAPLNKSVVDEYLRLADGYAGDHLDAQAEPLYRKAIELHGIVAGGTSCEMVDTLGRYRRFLSIRGREDEARVIVDRIRTTQRSCRESAPPPRRRGW